MFIQFVQTKINMKKNNNNRNIQSEPSQKEWEDLTWNRFVILWNFYILILY